ncbi:MAG: hypothetical protein LBS26_07150 [Campylobacteraceae bacterium]|jgi:hypothetical protein|nr:hypothetical protein [Campylobacteraceae bacterium]
MFYESSNGKKYINPAILKQLNLKDDFLIPHIKDNVIYYSVNPVYKENDSKIYKVQEKDTSRENTNIKFNLNNAAKAFLIPPFALPSAYSLKQVYNSINKNKSGASSASPLDKQLKDR